MLIRTLNISEITEALSLQVGNWPALHDVNLCVEISEVINESASRTPWLGIYPTSVTYEERTLGLGAGYRRQAVEITMIIQAADITSGNSCHQTLGSLVGEATSAILSDSTLGGSVDTVGSLQVRYDYAQTGDNAYLQSAIITLTAERAVGIN